jgi:hypothetical protein
MVVACLVVQKCKACAAGHMSGLVVTTDGGDSGTRPPTPLAQALLCQHVHLCPVWFGPGMLPIHPLGPLIKWISDTLSQGCTNVQSLVRCLDHRGVASATVCSQASCHALVHQIQSLLPCPLLDLMCAFSCYSLPIKQALLQSPSVSEFTSPPLNGFVCQSGMEMSCASLDVCLIWKSYVMSDTHNATPFISAGIAAFVLLLPIGQLCLGHSRH